MKPSWKWVVSILAVTYPVSILTAGLGGMGGAQTLASTMAGASMLAVECDASRIQKRLDTGYCDAIAIGMEALDQICEACGNLKQPISPGLLGNAAEIYPEICCVGGLSLIWSQIKRLRMMSLMGIFLLA